MPLNRGLPFRKPMRLLVALGIVLAIIAVAPAASAEICQGSDSYNGVFIDLQGGVMVYYPGGYIGYSSSCPSS
jgi:hypothetical protein